MPFIIVVADWAGRHWLWLAICIGIPLLCVLSSHWFADRLPEAPDGEYGEGQVDDWDKQRQAAQLQGWRWS